jgi:hypothetical protein
MPKKLTHDQLIESLALLALLGVAEFLKHRENVIGARTAPVHPGKAARLAKRSRTIRRSPTRFVRRSSADVSDPRASPIDR